MKVITVIELNNVGDYPPVQNLIRVLLDIGFKVNLIGRNISKVAKDICENENYTGYETAKYTKIDNMIQATVNRVYTIHKARRFLNVLGTQSDYVWTTSMKSVQVLGKRILKYKNVLQLMELAENGYLILERYIKFPIDEYARQSWKTVVPEINRAYIQKVWWNLKNVPVVLPNKPYSNNYGDITDDIKTPLEIMKNEKKRIILYLGVVGTDRDLESLARIVSKSQDYVIYIAGKVHGEEAENLMHKMLNLYHCVYLGEFNPPKHLALVKYAYIGVLPYKPVISRTNSELNALYCAPNKIWEYAGFGVPMVGSDVLGLKLPFEQWNIGRCCDLNDETEIIKAIEEVDKNHDEMSQNCYKFYDSVDLEKIVSEILEDEN